MSLLHLGVVVVARRLDPAARLAAGVTLVGVSRRHGDVRLQWADDDHWQPLRHLSLSYLSTSVACGTWVNGFIMYAPRCSPKDTMDVFTSLMWRSRLRTPTSPEAESLE